MILSIEERNFIENTYEIVVGVELSLNYQIKKILDLCLKIDYELDMPRENWYISSIDFQYNVDFLINNFSVLIEYYHSWVIQYRIGLSKPNIKIEYKAIKYKDSKSIDEVLRKYGVGKTDRPELYNFDLYKECKSRYKSDMNSFFIGKNHELFVLNNYIKHNHIINTYAPITAYIGIRLLGNIWEKCDKEF